MVILKTKDQVRDIRKACSATDSVFRQLVRQFRKGALHTELDVARFLYSLIRKRGLKPAFRIIVASGKNAASPHHKPGNSALRGFVVVDFGVRQGGMLSDMTRTVYFGKPNWKEENLYYLLKKTQAKMIDSIKPDMKCSAAHALALKLLGRYGKYFIHGLGHGVGKRVHEAPRINAKSRHYLRRGMAVTVEPGIYVKKRFGMRIEDTCLIKLRSCTALTKSTKQLLSFRLPKAN